MYRIMYSNCWEDAEVVNQALDIKRGKSYLSIASAGDNTLSMLAQDPKLVLAVDKNPAQLACLDLRRAAIKYLSHADALAFLGVHGSNSRITTYQRIRSSLSPFARCFWDQHNDDVRHGMIHAGITEKNFRRFRKYVLPMAISKKNRQKLLQNMSVEERTRFCEHVLHKKRYRVTMRTLFNRTLIKQFRIGTYSTFHRSGNGNLAETIMKRVKKGISSRYAPDNPYVIYIMTGNYHNVLPYYLQRSVFTKIKMNIDSLAMFSGTIQQALQAHPQYRFHGFNLSDIFEYMPSVDFQSCVQRIVRHAADNARLVYWNTLKRRAAARTLPGQLHARTDLVHKLQRINRSFFYDSMMIDEVMS